MPESFFISPRKCLGTVAYIAVGNNPEPFTWSMVQLVQFCNEYVCTEAGEWIHWAHNTKSGQIIARNALAQGMMGDWLLMLDSDHDFEPDLLYRLLSAFTARDMDVLGGFYQFKEFPHQPMAWLYLPDKGGYCQVASPSDAEGKTTTWDRTAPNMLMGVIGGGCMLISRRAIEMLVTKFGDAPFNPIGIYGTDDFDFCERCRLAGIQVWWSTRIECPHLQTRAITLADYGQAHVMGNVA
jgi:GT2 family glycosyltransferase